MLRNIFRAVMRTRSDPLTCIYDRISKSLHFYQNFLISVEIKIRPRKGGTDCYIIESIATATPAINNIITVIPTATIFWILFKLIMGLLLISFIPFLIKMPV